MYAPSPITPRRMQRVSVSCIISLLMIARRFPISALLILVILASTHAVLAADRMRLVSIPLGMPLSDEEALDNQALEGLYQGDYGKHMKYNFGGYLGDNVMSSGLDESPFYHIDTVLKDGRKLQLWFSSAADGHKIFGVHLGMPWPEKPSVDFKQAVAELEGAWGKADLRFKLPFSKGGQQILIFVDRSIPKEHYERVVAQLPAADKLGANDVENFWRNDLQEWVRKLGPEFRGAIAIMTDQNGKLVGEQITMIDLVRARTVFNLAPGR